LATFIVAVVGVRGPVVTERLRLLPIRVAYKPTMNTVCFALIVSAVLLYWVSWMTVDAVWPGAILSVYRL
jgi:hypothetical protein